MKVFVTGATGFVGSHLVDALLERGNHVTSLVRSPAKAQRVFAKAKPRLFSGSLTDASALRNACADADVVYHLAGLTAARDRDAFFHVNAGGTQAVLDAVREAAPNLRRFVYVSSLAAAGPTRCGQPLVESDPPRPISNYGASKLAGEEATQAGGLPWSILRPPAVYGPRDVELRRVFRLARLGLTTVFGDGSQELSLVHVADLIRALLAVADAPVAGHTYFVCHPEVVTQREFVSRVRAAVREALGKRPADGRPLTIGIPAWVARPVLATSGYLSKLVRKPSVLSADKTDELLAEAWLCSPAALETDTGWRAEIPLVDGLHDTARWYRQHGWL